MYDSQRLNKEQGNWRKESNKRYRKTCRVTRSYKSLRDIQYFRQKQDVSNILRNYKRQDTKHFLTKSDIPGRAQLSPKETAGLSEDSTLSRSTNRKRSCEISQPIREKLTRGVKSKDKNNSSQEGSIYGAPILQAEQNPTATKQVKKISANTVVPISRRYVRVRQSYSNLFKGYTLRCGDFTMEQKLKQRICIEICVKLQISATETFDMLNKAFPNDLPKRTTVFE
ncbi:hypothetical protein LAZ67_1000926 [Cordylochernes scorpioides]|uniref:Uncharacterized protein n=1 Tax=Cordylochernes scorpioides TaxID=51811 RepID=A0ABY6JWJ3_9ARAC|nr:hypothetical protein LAZ67_1000926 [Cordylochernes scorpioides]